MYRLNWKKWTILFYLQKNQNDEFEDNCSTLKFYLQRISNIELWYLFYRNKLLNAFYIFKNREVRQKNCFYFSYCFFFFSKFDSCDWEKDNDERKEIKYGRETLIIHHEITREYNLNVSDLLNFELLSRQIRVFRVNSRHPHHLVA